MKPNRIVSFTYVLAALLTLASSTVFSADIKSIPPYEPKWAQPGKDVIWIPTQDALVEKMLEMANAMYHALGGLGRSAKPQMVAVTDASP